jgi:hypothetical protein
MIHQFQTKNCAPVIMLDDLTERIFNVLGRPFEPKGIFLTEQIPGYIATLEKAIEAERTTDQEKTKSGLQAQKIKKDPLGRRAHPFLELLKQSQKNGEPIIWGVN